MFCRRTQTSFWRKKGTFVILVNVFQMISMCELVLGSKAAILVSIFLEHEVKKGRELAHQWNGLRADGWQEFHSQQPWWQMETFPLLHYPSSRCPCPVFSSWGIKMPRGLKKIHYKRRSEWRMSQYVRIWTNHIARSTGNTLAAVGKRGVFAAQYRGRTGVLGLWCDRDCLFWRCRPCSPGLEVLYIETGCFQPYTWNSNFTS